MTSIILNYFKPLFIIITVALFLSSCSEKSNSVSHIPVKVKGDKDYSFINLETGEINFSDEFSERPSLINEGVFYTINNNDEYEYHKINDFTGENVENNTSDFPGGPYINGGLFNEGIAIVVESNEYPKAIDENGKIVFEINSDDGVSALYPICTDGRIMFRSSENGLIGFLNKKGEVAISPQFSVSIPFSNGYSKGIRILKGKREVIVFDINGELVMNYDKIGYVGEYFDGNFISQIKEDKFALINSEKKEIIDFDKKFDNVSKLGDNLIYKIDGKWGVINSDGEKIIRAKYDFITNLDSKNDVFVATKNRKNEYDVLNSEGNKIYSDDGDAVGLRNNKLLVKEGIYWTLKDKDNKEISDDLFKIRNSVIASLIRLSNHYIYDNNWIESDYFNKSPIISFFKNDISKSLVLGSKIDQSASEAYQIINNSLPNYTNNNTEIIESEYSYDYDNRSFYRETNVMNYLSFVRFGMGFDDDATLKIYNEEDDIIETETEDESLIELENEVSEPEFIFKSVAPELNAYTSSFSRNIILDENINLDIKFYFSSSILKRINKEFKVESGYGSYITSKHIGNEWNKKSKVKSISGRFDISSRSPKANDIIKEIKDLLKNSGWSLNGKYFYKDDKKLRLRSKSNGRDVAFEFKSN